MKKKGATRSKKQILEGRKILGPDEFEDSKPNGPIGPQKRKKMTTETVKAGLEITELADLKYSLYMLECSKWQNQGVVRLLDFAELDGKKWGQSMRLHIVDRYTGKWVLFNPPKQAIRTLAAWNQFLRVELNWTYRILISVAVAE